MRVAINLLTDDPAHPSGAHWFWTRVIPEMAARLEEGEELHLMVSPRSRAAHQGYGPGVRYLGFPWSNERQRLRVLSEQVYAPPRLRASRIDVLNTLIAPLVRPAPAVVAHFKTMHAFTAPSAIPALVRAYRRTTYPHTAKVASAIIINSESLRQEVLTHLDIDPRKLRMIPEAVDHSTFRPGDPDEARAQVRKHGVDRPFLLFVSSLWPYKNLDGLLRALSLAKPQLDGHRLVVVGPGRDSAYVSSLHNLARELGVADDVVWVGGLPLDETVHFYRAAAAFAYPSFNETFGLPILEAMASGCPVVTSDRSAMAETAGGAAILADPYSPESLADALIKACGAEGAALRPRGLARAAQFSWARTGALTLEVYREVHRARGKVPA
jgi:glycosyltransferase involved in cell wall biosynthesis